MYEIIEASSLEDNDENVTILPNEVENGETVEDANIETIFTEEETCDTNVINTIKVAESNSILTSIDDK